MREPPRSLHPLMMLVILILLIAALRASRVVTMPLGMALAAVVLAWPLERRLERSLPRGLSLAITLLALLFAAFAFGGALYLCIDSVASKVPEYEERVVAYWDAAATWTTDHKFPIQLAQFDLKNLAGTEQDALGLLGRLASGLYDFLGLFVLLAAFVILALLEVRSFRYKLVERVGTPYAIRFVAAGEEIARNIQRFVLTRTLTSAVTGLLTTLFTAALGLELALVWGAIAFLLNYIPVIGSVIAVIPPTLVALLQPEAIWLAPAILGGLTVIQFTIGNYVDPRLQGRFLSLSPLIVFYSIAFWGWVWGIPGALLAVPLTVSITILCRHFPATEWIAELVSNHDGARPIRTPEPHSPVDPPSTPRVDSTANH